MANRYPVVFSLQPSSGQLPLENLESYDQLIDPATGQPYLSVAGSGRLTWGAAAPSDPLQTYATGDACFNEDPATNKSIAGWVCTVPGIGGVAVWVPFYVVHGTPQNNNVILWDGQKALWAVVQDQVNFELRDLINAAASEAWSNLQDAVADVRSFAEGIVEVKADEIEDTDKKNFHELSAEIGAVASEANAALQVGIAEAKSFAEGVVASEVTVLNARDKKNFNELNAALNGVAAEASNDLQAGIAEAKSFAEGVVASEVTLLNARDKKNFNELNAAINEAASSANNDLQNALAEAKSFAEGAVASEVTVLNTRDTKNFNELNAAINGVASEANNNLQDGVSEAKSFAEGVVAAEATTINKLVKKKDDELTTAINGVATAANNDLQEGIAEAKSFAEGAVAAESVVINERIGKKYLVTTLDATPTVLATVTPSPYKAVRLFMKIVAHRLDHLEAAVYNVLSLARAVPASGVLTLAVGVPTAGETVTIGTTVYTWQNVLGAAYDVMIGGTITASIENLVKAINLTGVAGTHYGVGTAKHPTASAVKASATTLEAVAQLPGVAGNAIATTVVMVNGSWGAVTLLTGLDMALFGPLVTTEYEDDASWVVAVAAVGAGVDVSVTGVLDTPIKWSAEITSLELF